MSDIPLFFPALNISFRTREIGGHEVYLVWFDALLIQNLVH